LSRDTRWEAGMTEVRGMRGARRPRKLVVPDVAGLALSDAQIVLEQVGFAPATPRYTLSYEEVGTVVSQQPARGLLVDSTTPIELAVSMPSWMRYLPQIYQVSSDESNAFSLNFLWIFQQIHDSVKSRIDNVHTLFQAADAPPEFLGWLASWIALQLEDDWDEVKRRKWLRFAPTLYSIRGTKRALEQLLEVYVGVKPTIYENEWPEGAFRVEVSSVIGESSTILPPMSLTNCFVVELPLSPSEVSEEQLIRIHRVIRAEKPAHTNYFLRFESTAAMDEWGPFMTIGEASVGDDD
jgi:phage tail-like protein